MLLPKDGGPPALAYLIRAHELRTARKDDVSWHLNFLFPFCSTFWSLFVLRENKLEAQRPLRRRGMAMVRQQSTRLKMKTRINAPHLSQGQPQIHQLSPMEKMQPLRSAKKRSECVLLLSQAGDPHIPPVKEALDRLGAPVLCCDLADFPQHLQLSAQLSSSPWRGTLVNRDHISTLEQIKSIWWRRPTRAHAPDGYGPAAQIWLDQEAYYGFLGLLLGPPGGVEPFWVSRPQSIRAAEFKASQLAAAQALGLRIPRTLFTNDPAAARAFYEQLGGRVVCKAVWKSQLPLSEETATQPRYMYTNRVRVEHLAWLDGVRTTMHCFQEYIEKRCDLRVVVIGRQIFAVEIHAQSERARLDWRRSYADLRYAVHQLPAQIEQALFSLVRLFGLHYSAMDLLLTPDGEYIWLELNPNGQFLWLSQPTELPLAEAMAQLLRYPKEYGLW